jgi:hypothetical protein
MSRPGREADHTPPSSTEVKNAWHYTSIPQYVLLAWCLVKHTDNFTFTFPCKVRLQILPVHRELLGTCLSDIEIPSKCAIALLHLAFNVVALAVYGRVMPM